jgi:hypothetical protein
MNVSPTTPAADAVPAAPRAPGDVVALLRRLAVRDGLALGGLYSGRRAEFDLVLATAAVRFAPGRDYTEAEVNAVLKAWLAADAVMLSTDHVEARRWLVDTGLLGRDGYGRAYRRTLPVPAAFAALQAALERVDVGATVAAARAADRSARAERRARFATAPTPSGTVPPPTPALSGGAGPGLGRRGNGNARDPGDRGSDDAEGSE